jgi:hypothetical protein
MRQWLTNVRSVLEVNGAVESAAAHAERIGEKRELKPPNDTMGIGARVENRTLQLDSC